MKAAARIVFVFHQFQHVDLMGITLGWGVGGTNWLDGGNQPTHRARSTPRVRRGSLTGLPLRRRPHRLHGPRLLLTELLPEPAVLPGAARPAGRDRPEPAVPVPAGGQVLLRAHRLPHRRREHPRDPRRESFQQEVRRLLPTRIPREVTRLLLPVHVGNVLFCLRQFFLCRQSLPRTSHCERL